MNRQKQYRSDNPEKVRLAKIKFRYGLSADEWAALLLDQEGRCAICKTDLADAVAHVDHDHKTGKVRGILCNHCNRGLGAFKDSPESLKNAIGYLL